MKAKTIGWGYLLMGAFIMFVCLISKPIIADKIPFGIIIGGIGFILLDRAGELK